jgi:ABC transporter family protein
VAGPGTPAHRARRRVGRGQGREVFSSSPAHSPWPWWGRPHWPCAPPPAALSTTMNAISFVLHRRLLPLTRRGAPSATTAFGDHRTRAPATDPARQRVLKLSRTRPAAPEGIALTLRRDEIVALVGENGSGTTTPAEILPGFYPPTGGTGYWDDPDLAAADRASIHSRIAVITQDPAHWPMTATSPSGASAAPTPISSPGTPWSPSPVPTRFYHPARRGAPVGPALHQRPEP